MTGLTAPWTEAGTVEALSDGFLTITGAALTMAHMLVERGEVDLDAPVAKYWPEFAASSKADAPVRWLLSHPVGLVALDQPVPLKDALAWHRWRQHWPPNAQFGLLAQHTDITAAPGAGWSAR
ncbi:serine hydrolase domain-containing protein [Streptomyces sp. Amel2xE9]|uniref:serine hydrolase domain-containing protein n=1 Tax=Streptomyces sp. SID8381 TaxID=2690361 RepID=UPI002D21ECEA|nr:serine hydrolase domain-containing protein [Streptomyces sp. Amel2xE9]